MNHNKEGFCRLKHHLEKNETEVVFEATWVCSRQMESYPAMDKNHFLVTKAQYKVRHIRELLEVKESLAKQMI